MSELHDLGRLNGFWVRTSKWQVRTSNLLAARLWTLSSNGSFGVCNAEQVNRCLKETITSILPDETVPVRYPYTHQSLRPRGALARPHKPRAPYKLSGLDARRGTPEPHHPDRETQVSSFCRQHLISSCYFLLFCCTSSDYNYIMKKLWQML